MMTPHGPDAQCFDTASNAQLKPVRVADGTQVNRTSRKNTLKAFNRITNLVFNVIYLVTADISLYYTH